MINVKSLTEEVEKANSLLQDVKFGSSDGSFRGNFHYSHDHKSAVLTISTNSKQVSIPLRQLKVLRDFLNSLEFS